MRFLVLACDYDETLARHGRVDATTIDALQRLVASGRKVILVTGRSLDDLSQVMPDLRIFTRVVAENGAVSYDPATRSQKKLAEAPSPSFVELLRTRGVTP